MKTVTAILFFTVLPHLTFADTYIFEDTTISEGSDWGRVYVYNTFPAITHVTITGGQIDGYNGYSDTHLSFIGGISTKPVDLRGNATAEITSGEITGLSCHANSSALFSGGTIPGQIFVEDQSTITITGGAYGKLNLKHSAVAHIRGGQCLEQITVNSTNYRDVEFWIYGLDFAYDPDVGNYNGGQLTGTWANGTSFSSDLGLYWTFGCITLANPMAFNCPIPPEMDFNKDCVVDSLDFALFLDAWLDCNLEPIEACTRK